MSKGKWLVLGCLLTQLGWGQSRTYRVENNGIETVGYCTLKQGQVVHKYTSLPVGDKGVDVGERSMTVSVPEYGNTEERVRVCDGVLFDQVFNTIHARYCIRQGYNNFNDAVRERNKLSYARKIKAILSYYNEAYQTLVKDGRDEVALLVDQLARYTEEFPFSKGKPAKGAMPEYVRLVERALSGTLVFCDGVKPEYSVVMHKATEEEVLGKKGRR